MTYIIDSEISAFSEKQESSWNLPQTRTNVSTYSLQDVIKAMIMASEMKRSKCNFPSTALVCVEHAAPFLYFTDDISLLAAF